MQHLMRSSRLGKSSNCGGQSVLTSAASQTFVVLFRWIAFPPQSWRRLVAWHVVSKAPIFHIQCRQSIFGVAPYPPPIFHSNTESHSRPTRADLESCFSMFLWCVYLSIEQYRHPARSPTTQIPVWKVLVLIHHPPPPQGAGSQGAD